MDNSSKNFDFGQYFGDFIKNNQFVDASNSVSENEYEDKIDWKEQYRRLQSDFDSFRNRTKQNLEKEEAAIVKKVILGFLDILDFALYTYRSKQVNGCYTKEDELLFNRLNGFLKEYGVEPLDVNAGNEFDYTTMNAILSRKTEDEALVNTVSECVKKGYRMKNGDILRPADVIVWNA